MAVNESVREHYAELLAGLGVLKLKPMFGGLGVSCQDLFFGLIAGEILYLKVDDVTESAFASEGAPRFEFTFKNGRTGQMRYRQLPESAQEDPDSARHWAQLAMDAAARARKPSKQGKGLSREDIGPGPWDG